MTKLVLDTVTSGFRSGELITSNNTATIAAMENTLSRDGTGPNFMQAQLDMNGFNILNQGNPVTVQGFDWQGSWITGTTYQDGKVVEFNGSAYISVITHVAGVFTTDLSAGYWQLVASASLPSQAGAVNGLLTSNGSTASWLLSSSYILGLLVATTAVGARTILEVPAATDAILTGVPTAPTAALDTTTTQLATTEFVINQAATSLPTIEAAVGVVGTSGKYARSDHVHPQRNVALSSPVSTSSGNSVVLTTILPNWARKVTLNFSGVSTNGTAGLSVQIGGSGGIETSGYVSTASSLTSSVATSSSTAGFLIRSTSASANLTGMFSLSLYDINNRIWSSSHTLLESTTSLLVGAGQKQTSTVATQIRITAGGSDVFDAGAVSISWE